MKVSLQLRSKLLSAVIFSLIFSGCVSQTQTANFDKEQAAKARVELAMGYLQQHDFAQAKLNLDKALSYAPSYYLVHSVLAYFYQQQGQINEAKLAYLKALDLDNQQGDVHNNFGAFLCRQGEFNEAYQQFDLALVSPHYYAQADTYENIILCRLSAKDMDKIPNYLQALQKIDAPRAEKLKSLIK